MSSDEFAISTVVIVPVQQTITRLGVLCGENHKSGVV